jgi:hypothetical protein
LGIAKSFRIQGAERILQQVREAVSMWSVLAKANGVSQDTLQAIAGPLQTIDRRF